MKPNEQSFLQPLMLEIPGQLLAACSATGIDLQQFMQAFINHISFPPDKKPLNDLTMFATMFLMEYKLQMQNY